MGRDKKRRYSSSSSTSSSENSSSSDSDCAGRYSRKKHSSKTVSTTNSNKYFRQKRHCGQRVDVNVTPRQRQRERSADRAESDHKTRSYTPVRDSSDLNVRQCDEKSSDIGTVGSVDPNVGQSSTSTTQNQSRSRIDQLEELVVTLLQKDEERNVRVSIRPDCIPEFDPNDRNDSCSRWLDKIDQLSSINKWDEKTTIYHMQSRLVGFAKVWYNGLNSYKHSWSDWKRMLILAFPDHQDFPTALRKMITRVKIAEETWTEYYFSKVQLLRQCNIEGKNAVAMIIDGIPDTTIQSGAKVGRYESPELLYSEYLSTLSTTREARPDRNIAMSRRQFSDSNKNDYTHQKRRTSKPTKCFNCHKLGHMQRECPKPRVECTICKRLGHLANNCRNNKPSTSRNAMVCNYSERSEADNYCVTCRINGKELNGFVDSGCEVVIIRQSDAQKVGLTWNESDICLNGYGGSTTKVLGVSHANLEVDLFKTGVDIFVVPDHTQNMPVLIGRSLLNKENAITVIQKGNVRLFNAETTELPQIEHLPAKKIKLVAKSSTEIPPNHVGIVSCTSNEDGSGDIFVDLRRSLKPNAEYVIPRCVVSSTEIYLPVLNVSMHSICFNVNKLVARGERCVPEVSGVSVNKISKSQLSKFTREDLQGHVDGNVSDTDLKNLLLLLNKYRDCFALNVNELGTIKNHEMSIELTDDKPVTYRPYRLSISERDNVRKIVNELLAADIIQESNSPYSSPIVLVKKKNGDTRMCVDYRALNAKTVKDCYPLPRVDDHLEVLKGCKFFTTLDMASGYHQIKIAKSSRRLTSFVTPDGQYEYKRMPFGLVNAPSEFQRAINKILGSMRLSTAMAYLDDIFVPSTSITSGLIALGDVLNVLREAGVTLQFEKCQFFQTKLEYLGHEISAEGVRPGLQKIRAVSNFPEPKNVHQVRQFIGLCSYFRKYVKCFAEVARPLTSLTKKDVPYVWGQAQNNAFELLKRKLVERPILAIYNPSFETELHTDASMLGLGGILLQRQCDNNLKPVMYFSRQTTKEEQKYHSYELETLAVVNSLQRFRVYLLGLRFKVVTDCNALRTAMTKRDLIPRIGRWWLITQEFNFEVEYRPGPKMAHVDALSRNPTEKPNKTNQAKPIDILQVDISTDDWILATQLKDEQCEHLLDILAKKPNDNDEKQIHKDYVIKDNRLYRNTSSGPKWYVPKSARRVVTMYHHDNKGHFALEKTLKAISDNYWFPRMRKYVNRYISACLACAYNKSPAGKQEGFLNPIDKVSSPMDTMHIDHLGPFIKSSKGNTHLIVAVDAFTKFLSVKAVKNTQTRPVVAFLEGIFQTFGVPRRIICDRGTCFTSDVFKKFTKDLGILVVLNATATPRANGQVERYNRTLLTAIAASSDDERRWDQTISSIVFAINSAANCTTGKSPNELLFGFKPRGMADSFLSNTVVTDVVDGDIEKTRNEASLRIIDAQGKQKRRYDAKRKASYQYKVGDLVVLRRTNYANEGRSQKLVSKYTGPYEVKKILDHDRYVVKDLSGSSRARKKYEGVRTSDQMKPFIPAYESGSNTASESDVNDDN